MRSSLFNSGTSPALLLRVIVAPLLALVIFSGHVAFADAPEEWYRNRDIHHTMLVRRALFQDRELRPLNLGVRVTNGVADLWGAAPSQRVLNKAVRLVENMPEIGAVRSMLSVEEPDDFLPRYLPSAPVAPVAPTPWQGRQWETGTTPTLPARSETETKTPLTSSVWDKAPTPDSSSLWQAADSTPPIHIARPTSEQQKPPRRQGPVDVFQKTVEKFNDASAPTEPVRNNEGAGLTIVPRVRIPLSPPEGLTTARHTAGPSLQQRITTLQSRNALYRHLRLDVDGGRVHMSGAIQHGRDLHQLAQTIARLPGVENVVIGPVQVWSQPR